MNKQEIYDKIEENKKFNNNSNLPLINASRLGYIDIVKFLLLDDFFDPTAYCNKAIYFASNNHHYDIVNLLLQDKRVESTLSEKQISFYKKLLLQDKICKFN